MACLNLLDLPPEIHLQISQHFPWLKNLSNFARTNRRLYALLNPYLYSIDAKPFNLWALYWAAETGSVETAKIALEAGTPVNTRTGRPSYFHRKLYLRAGATPLAVAAAFGRVDVISLLLESGADASLVNDRGQTPLYIAAVHGHSSAVKALLEHSQAQLHSPCHSWRTLVSGAISGGHVAVVRILLASMDVKTTEADNQWSELLKQALKARNKVIYNMILHNCDAISAAAAPHSEAPQIPVIFSTASAAIAKSARRLIRAGADVEDMAHDTWRPLLTALSHLQFHTWVNHNAVPVTPLSVACVLANAHFVRVLLMHGADSNVAGGWDRRGRSCLDIACNRGQLDIVRLLLNFGAKPTTADADGVTPLHRACGMGHVEIVTLLLHHGADPEAKTLRNQVPLVFACFQGQQARRLEIVQALLNAGADPNAHGRGDATTANDPLYVACLYCHHDIVKLLLMRGAECSLSKYPNETLLHASCRAGDAGTVQMWLQHGFDPTSRTMIYQAPLYYACCGDTSEAKPGRAKVLELLLAIGADPNTTDIGGSVDTPLRMLCETDPDDIDGVRILLDAGADVNMPGLKGLTPLHSACGRGNYNLANLLLNRGADISAVTERHETPLHMVPAIPLGHKLVELLLEHGADPAALTKDGTTCLENVCETHHDLVSVASVLISHGAPLRPSYLSHAVAHNSVRLVELLLAKGIDPGITDRRDGKTVLHTAAEIGSLSLVSLFLRTGRVDKQSRDKSGQTALDIARTKGFVHLTQCL